MPSEAEARKLPQIVRPKPLRERVYEILRKEILNGEFSANDTLVEEQLANELGVSRTPVREAIQRLKVEGLVTGTDGGRARVHAFDRDGIAQALEIRGILESYACERAAQNISEEELSILRDLSNKELEGIQNNDFELMSQLNSAIHEHILAASGNEVLMHLVDHLQARVPSYRIFALGNIDNLRKFSESHGRIIDLLAAGDAKAAAEEMSRHVRMAKDVMLGTYAPDRPQIPEE